MSARQPRRFRVLGALGSGLTSPLLVEPEHPPSERLVLCRPSDPQVQARLRRVDRGVAVEREVVDTDRGRLALVSFVEGADGASLPAVLSPGTVRSLLAAVVEILLEAESCGVRHGALQAERVRIRPDGKVVLVRFEGGESDLAALRDLAQHWLGIDEPTAAPDDAWRDRLMSWPESLSALAAWLGPADPRALEAVAQASAAPVLHPPPTSVISQRGPAIPPRVQLAAIGAVMLALGAGAGISLFGWRAPPALEVAGAAEVRLDCDPRVIGAARLPLDGPSVCRVEARMSAGGTMTGELDGPLDRSYVCGPADGGLRCVGR